ncbi:MAG: glycosyltransferase family A protein [Ignavibacteriaceae bacterium]|jgi:glycosyltransferase involved in cell wall biosynthesis|nr:glycosyltransferase family A protein [Ignavibacteriaceae bacterium]
MNTVKYVLITAAKNEELFIEKTIQSVLNQTIIPEKWIIVSDGSTDRTNNIVEQYSSKNKFIDFVALPPGEKRNFGSKVIALNKALKKLEGMNFNFIGNLDADLTLDNRYYEDIFNRFSSNPKLGVGGGIILDNFGDKVMPQNISLNTVAGGIQVFRKECFDKIGNYLPFKYGGEDAYMETTARMLGWDVQTFAELKILHHRPTGTGMGSLSKANLRSGKMFYTLGYSLIFLLVRCFYRIFDKPVLIGSFLTILGYFSAFIKREKCPAGDSFITFVRSEQRERLKSLLPFNKKRTVVKTSRMIKI